jgi:hypothetical protein
MNQEKGSRHTLRGALLGPLVYVPLTRTDREEQKKTRITLHFVHSHYCWRGNGYRSFLFVTYSPKQSAENITFLLIPPLHFVPHFLL